MGTESDKDESDEESYEHSFVDSDENECGSEDSVKVRSDLCAVYRNTIKVTERL